MSPTGGPVTDRERLARVALSQLAEPGDLRMAGLVAELGAVEVCERLLEQRSDRPEQSERDVDGVLTDVAGRLAELQPHRDLERAERQGIRFLVPGDPEWPVRVDDLDEAEPVNLQGGRPLGLWVRGPLRLDQVEGAVAVVGSRSSTSYGEDVATELGLSVSRAGRVVISGAAFGIDQAAHRGALTAGAPTVAVLACGVDRAYPAAHRELLAHVVRDGAVVSELAPGRSPMRQRFLTRNRVIAALGVGTVVVEAAVRSGALSTATWAGRLNRVLMGVPGPVTSAASEGVHQLVRSDAAVLVTRGADVLELVGAAGSHLVEVPRAEPTARDRLPARERRVLEAVPVSRGVRSDAVARTAGLGLVEVRSALGALEHAGLVLLDEHGWRLAPRAP